MYTKKSLGQHFLRSDKALATIVRTAELTSSDTVLEIGPGEGVLTKKLLEQAGKVVAVEKDDRLYEVLSEKFSKYIENGKLELINGDILEFEPESSFKKTYKLVANIPYNITGAIIRKFLSTDKQPSKMVLLVQKEVADRIVAKDGKESILSISIKAYGDPKYIETVKAGSFTPPPKVDSAIISITNINKEFFTAFSEEKFFELLHAGFKSKRKKLISNIKPLFSDKNISEIFRKLNLDENIRAEELKLENWKRLSEERLK